MIRVVDPSRPDFSIVEVEKLRRGKAIKRRREAHGIRSLRQWAEVAGINRATLAKVEDGTGSDEMLSRAEAFLDRLDAERSMDTREPEAPVALDPELSQDLIEFDITGPRTEWHVVVRGPAEIADELRRQAAELLRDIDPSD